MTKNSLFILVVLFVIGFGIWFTKFGQELKKTQTLVAESNDDTQRLLKRRTAAAPEVATSTTPGNSLQRDRLQQEVQDLSNQLLQENQKLDTQKQYLDQLRLKNNPDRLELNYSNQVSQAQQEIQYLTDTLNNEQFSESRLQQEVQRLQREQDVSLRFYNEQMDQNILQQEAVVRKAQQDLQDWELNYNDLTLQEQKVRELQGQLAEQSQLLQDMKVQKLQLAAQSLERTQQIQEQARDVASQNNADRSEIQEEIASLRDEIQRLEYSYRQTRFTQMSAQAKIDQAERNLQGQEDVIRSIRELLQEKQTQLNQRRPE